MRRIGLTGGIGSGKSTVARMFAELGAHVIDADAVAREVVEPGTPGLAALVEEFGNGILDGDRLDRTSLAQIVFEDEGARTRLNAIIHPLIGARTAELIAALPPDAVFLHDVPLLVELHLENAYDLVVVVDAPDDVRVSRLVERGLTEDDARARIATQATREQRLAVADVVINNSGDLDQLREQVRSAWPKVAARR
ncbi:MAG: dephospho-CoA kinase [Candidatus Nanopelagicales bacterium]